MNAACQRQQNPPARAESSAWARAGLLLIIISIVKFCTPKSEVTYLPDPALSLWLFPCRLYCLFLFDKNCWVNCVMSVMIYDFCIPPSLLAILCYMYLPSHRIPCSHNFRYLFAALPLLSSDTLIIDTGVTRARLCLWFIAVNSRDGKR